MPSIQARLVESREIAPEVRHFVFETPGLNVLPFTAGQFVSFSSEVQGRRITRAYSIASAPDGNRFELCLNRVQEGIYSPFLFQMSPGAEVEMKGPLGYFVPKNPFRDAVLVATGTGIAPFRSFLRSQDVIASDARISLLFGARYESGLLYRAEWDQLQETRPGFRFLPTITRPDAGWQGRTGWVQQHLEDALEERTQVDVYICGLKAMVNAVKEILTAKGFEKSQIVAEKYD